MRVGKKATVVEAKKTRSCVVRLEKVEESPPSRSVRSSTASSRVIQTSVDKNLRGPIKKRPITESPTPQQPTPHVATPMPKQKEKPKASQKIVKEPVYETPPTIAAGRSRRAIKPNPKYACDDMVTPKIIKNVATLGHSSASTPSTHKKTVASSGAGGGKERQRSTSSSEDFYNKESSDEMDNDMELDAVVDKVFQAVDKDNTDSDFSDIVASTPVPTRRRGRPRKEDHSATDATHNTPASTPASVNKAATATKPMSSQLQQLRKTLSSNVNRLPVLPSSGNKRKLEMSKPESTSTDGITTKRMKLISLTRQHELKKASDSVHHSSMEKGSSNQSLNGSKLTTTKDELQERRKILIQKTLAISQSMGKPSASRPPNTVLLNKTSSGSGSGKMLVSKPEATTLSIIAKTNSTKSSAANREDDVADKDMTTTSVADDIESMPTFTIVNINDIINKKGDVLISKAGQRPVPPKTIINNNNNTITSPDARLNKRKPGHISILSEKTDPEQLKQTLPRTPFPLKKQTILNKQAGSSSGSGGGGSSESSKPAPRILNSMVAKKTLPVKPLISNLDDSADESFPLSLDGDEDDDVDDPPELPSETVTSKRKLNSSLSPYLTAKKATATTPAPATKENSSALTNRMPIKSTPSTTAATTTSTQHKLSPEKVIISRQGDKVIKKITCFETWYVINMPQERPIETVRNQLEIPLIKLANASNSIELPSNSWSSKVTLYELSAATLAKSTPMTYTGDLAEHNINEEDRNKYQPLCVMFRRAVSDRRQSRLPYDRAVIFKNKTFFTNIEGKNVKLEGAPTVISLQHEVEILLQIVDSLTLQSDLVEPATTVQ